MPDWNDIGDEELDAGSPLTSSLFTRLARNPEAIAIGAPGAPRLMPGAFPEITAGDEVRFLSVGVMTSPSQIYSDGFRWTSLQAGSVRLRFVIGSNSGLAYARVYVDDVTVGTFSGSGAGVAHSVDLPISANSEIRVAFRLDNQGADRFASLSNVQLSTGGEWVFPVPPAVGAGKWSFQ
ncbi:hypothetical protein [Rhodovulum marinum]|uniref:Uncharacterized protein n=1 Tax=Rhodovulum marinum TaxID=320662 RepID=A0A4R2Q7N7_9RHOB|nr:hypothetical protein [Rhodovulum marinum]TCP43928.1 hypothetical protein EV662_10111 [Rhodovulum marinum]